MGRIRIGVAAVAFALALALVPASAEAKKKKPKPPTHAEKCEQAPAGGKGPLDHSQATYTNECFDSFESGIGATLQAIDSEVQGCPNNDCGEAATQLADARSELAKAKDKISELRTALGKLPAK